MRQLAFEHITDDEKRQERGGKGGTSISWRSKMDSMPAAAHLAARSLVKCGSCMSTLSRSHSAWLTIWLISIAASAGFNHPLLLITSTVAYVHITLAMSYASL